MNAIIEFGDRMEGYSVPVLNERAVRAGAGLLFVLAMMSFGNAWFTGDFQPTRVFVVAFLIEFTIRIFINPRYAPSLIIGQWIVRHQQPEWTGAPQKRFAWGIGFSLALIMAYLIVLNNVIGPINLLVCVSCLLLLFFETAFGICIGCKVYNWFRQDKAELCPGGVCEAPPVESPRVGLPQLVIVAIFALAVSGVARWVYGVGSPPRLQQEAPAVAAAPVDPREVERCKVPEFAKAIGHEEKWKLHNNCK